MYYKVFVPISFQVWPIFRLQVEIFVKLLPILWFWPLFGYTFWPFYVLSQILKLNKSNLTYIESLKAIKKCLYQLVFKSSQFSDSKLKYLLNFCRFCDFDHFRVHIWPFYVLSQTLKLNKSNLIYIESLKCIIKCLCKLVFKSCQFSDSKLKYLLNYCRFCDFDPYRGHILDILRPFAHFKAK